MLQDLLAWIQEGSPAAIITTILVSLACIGAFFVPFIVASRRGNKAATQMRQAAQSWASTSGTVMTSRVEVSGGTQLVTTPRVVYRYTVAGTEYEGNQIMAGDSHKFYQGLPSEEAYALVDKYPVNASVTVYYDLTNPANAALER